MILISLAPNLKKHCDTVDSVSPGDVYPVLSIPQRDAGCHLYERLAGVPEHQATVIVVQGEATIVAGPGARRYGSCPRSGSVTGTWGRGFAARKRAPR